VSAATPSYRWRLRGLMAERGMWKTTELIPLLADRGITLSATQVYRLVVGVPQRLSLHTLAALCDILGCTPNDLVDVQTMSADGGASR
jgi:DNA-binding Xre family transcriptional regulator